LSKHLISLPVPVSYATCTPEIKISSTASRGRPTVLTDVKTPEAARRTLPEA
jgi:hypothetical protein